MKPGAVLIATLLACSALVAGCSNPGDSGYRAESRCEDGKADCKTGPGGVQEQPDKGGY